LNDFIEFEDCSAVVLDVVLDVVANEIVRHTPCGTVIVRCMVSR
jgi:hypothetical protein